MNPRTREEEYLRRMKALGYEPSLAGMDDDDIEWELSKMEESDRRRETQQQPLEQPLQTVYRPVDPGLKARILRMFGQPYDESAIPKGQEFYLNGWDNGELDWGDGTEDKERGLSGATNSWFSGKTNPNVPAVKPLGVYKPGTVTLNSGEYVVGRDGVIRRAADEEALLKGIFAKSQGQGTGIINTGLFERGDVGNPDGFVQAMSYNPQTVKEGTKDLQQLPGLKKFSIGAGKDLANQSLASAQKYAKIKGLNSVEDNEADAFRHFTWNARMAREIGWEPADIIASNHEEVDWTENHGAKFDENGVATFEIPLSSLMDLHNNHVGRQMAIAKEYGNTHHEELFQSALKNGNIITALDQVPAFYGFDRNAVTTKRIGDRDVPFVRVTYDQGKRTFTFHPQE